MATRRGKAKKAMPARSNKGGAVRGKARAAQVQGMKGPQTGPAQFLGAPIRGTLPTGGFKPANGRGGNAVPAVTKTASPPKYNPGPAKRRVG